MWNGEQVEGTGRVSNVHYVVWNKQKCCPYYRWEGERSIGHGDVHESCHQFPTVRAWYPLNGVLEDGPMCIVARYMVYRGDGGSLEEAKAN